MCRAELGPPRRRWPTDPGRRPPRELADELAAWPAGSTTQAGRIRLVDAEHGLQRSVLPRAAQLSSPGSRRSRPAGGDRRGRVPSGHGEILLVRAGPVASPGLALAGLGLVAAPLAPGRRPTGSARRCAAPAPAALALVARPGGPPAPPPAHRGGPHPPGPVTPGRTEVPSLSVDELRRDLEHQAVRARPAPGGGHAPPPLPPPGPAGRARGAGGRGRAPGRAPLEP